MNTWSPHLFRSEAVKAGATPAVIANCLSVAGHILSISEELPIVFSLKHLALRVGINYQYLRDVVSRKRRDSYQVFRIPKKSSSLEMRGFRYICVPEGFLLHTQRWIATQILCHAKPSSHSYAFAPGDKIIKAAKQHCGCTWLIKLDVRNFFESISEISAYRVFKSLGYQPLVAFELARICTRIAPPIPHTSRKQWFANCERYTTIAHYSWPYLGHLPQGAPTSPMLSNLAMREFDRSVADLAQKNGLAFTRYADDICLSTNDSSFNRTIASDVIGQVYRIMGVHGLSPNTTKTRVASPRSRKIVLGLLVDGERPRLTREFRDNLRQHLHYLLHPDIGPIKHANSRNFDSVWGLRNHIEGLASHAMMVDPEFGKKIKSQLNEVGWPL